MDVVVAEILTTQGQLVVLEVGQEFLQLQEESFAGGVVVRPHMKLNVKLTSYLFHLTSDIIREQGCGWDSDGLMACGEQSPAVGAALGDVERLALFQQAEDRQIVDAALRALREAETGSRWFQVAGFRFQVT